MCLEGRGGCSALLGGDTRQEPAPGLLAVVGRHLHRISTCEGNTLTCFSFVNQTLHASKSTPTKGCSLQTRTFGHQGEPFTCITASRPAALCLPKLTFGSCQPHTSGFCTVKPVRTRTSGQKCSSQSMHSPQTQFPVPLGIAVLSSVLLEHFCLPGCCREP